MKLASKIVILVFKLKFCVCSTYTVNAIDAEELRKSQRMNRKGSRPAELMTTSQESDMNDDDEGLSTPTGENADRSMASMLSMR